MKRDDVGTADAAVVERMWSKHGSGALGEVRRLSGNSHRTFECASSHGESLIVRLADPARSRFESEAAVLHRCAASGAARVPDVRHVGVEAVPGGSVAVMVQERLPGVTLGAYAAESGIEQARAAVERAGETLAALHAVRIEGFGPLDAELRGSHSRLGEWFIDALAPKVAGARESDPESSSLLDGAFDLLAAHRPVLDAAAPGLVHGDFSPANVLVDSSGRITGVIDWESAKSGPPEMDIGWWDCFSDHPPTPAASLVAGHERVARFDPARLAALRHLTVIRVMIGHFTWTLSVGDRGGIRAAAKRLRAELNGAPAWRLAAEA